MKPLELLEGALVDVLSSEHPAVSRGVAAG